MARQRPHIVTGLRGLDKSSDSPFLIAADQCLDAVNVEFYRIGFARKRKGSTNIFSSTTSEAFSGADGIISVLRYVPGGDERAAELWALDYPHNLIQRLPPGTAWSSPTLKDAVSSTQNAMLGCAFNGLFFIAYKTAQDRLHAWDASTVRRAGLATSAAPTVANTGSGSYAATLRYYKVQYVVKSGSTYLRASELSAAVSFTPSGSGTHARITQPTLPSEGETHWWIWGSADGTVYQYITEVATGTTTYDDNGTVGSWSTTFAPLAGTFTNFPSVRYLTSDGNRLLGAGTWESGNKSRVYFSYPTAQTDFTSINITHPEEFYANTTDLKNYIDLNENDGGEITGFGGPIDGRVLVFKRNQAWRLLTTGLDTPVYRPRALFPMNSGVGAITQNSIINAEDEYGRPAVYWLSDVGPYRFGWDGPQFLGTDILTIWDGVNVNINAYSPGSEWSMHGVWYAAKKQIWWWVPATGQNDPGKLLVLDVQKCRRSADGVMRGGWSRYEGDTQYAQCSVMFSDTLADPTSRILKPYVGMDSLAIYKCDTGTDDGGESIQAYVDLPDRHFGGLGTKCKLGNAGLIGNAGSQELTVTYTPDYGAVTAASDAVSMAAGASETRVLRITEGVAVGDAHAVRVRVGDASANTASWAIDAVILPVEESEQQVTL